MTPEPYTIFIYQGSTFKQQYQVFDGTNTPLDLTGYSIDSDLRIAYTDVTASAVFNTSVLSPASSGTIELDLSPSASIALTEKCYLYDVRFTTGSTVYYAVYGKAMVKPAVTK